MCVNPVEEDHLKGRDKIENLSRGYFKAALTFSILTGVLPFLSLVSIEASAQHSAYISLTRFGRLFYTGAYFSRLDEGYQIYIVVANIFAGLAGILWVGLFVKGLISIRKRNSLTGRFPLRFWIPGVSMAALWLIIPPFLVIIADVLTPTINGDPIDSLAKTARHSWVLNLAADGSGRVGLLAILIILLAVGYAVFPRHKRV
jgi:hypothetical protein